MLDLSIFTTYITTPLDYIVQKLNQLSLNIHTDPVERTIELSDNKLAVVTPSGRTSRGEELRSYPLVTDTHLHETVEARPGSVKLDLVQRTS